MSMCRELSSEVFLLNTTASVYNNQGGTREVFVNKESLFNMCDYENIWVVDENPEEGIIRDPTGYCTTDFNDAPDAPASGRTEITTAGRITLNSSGKNLIYDFDTTLDYKDNDCEMNAYVNSCQNFENMLQNFHEERKESKKLCLKEHNQDACEKYDSAYSKANKKTIVTELKRCYHQDYKEKMKKMDTHDRKLYQKQKEMHKVLSKTKLDQLKKKGKKHKNKDKNKDEDEDSDTEDENENEKVTIANAVLCGPLLDPSPDLEAIACYEYELNREQGPDLVPVYTCSFAETDYTRRSTMEINEEEDFVGRIAEATGMLRFDDSIFYVKVDNIAKGEEYDCTVLDYYYDSE